MELGTIVEGVKVITSEVSKEAIENNLLIEYSIDEIKSNIEKDLMNMRLDEIDNIDFNPTEDDIKKNKYLFESLKEAEKNPEIRRAILNSLESNCKLKGDTGEYFASKNLEKIGKFNRSIPYEIGDRKNIIDFVCSEGLNKNESFNALRVSEDGLNIINERVYLPKGKSLAVEIKNGMSEINSRKHLKEQLEAGKSLCDRSFLGINKGMATEMINNPEKYINAINDLKTKADEIVILMPDVETQIAKMGGVDLSGYNFY